MGSLMCCHCFNITVRREIDSLNERLTGDGQAVDGGDPTKGALKTKGPIFTTQSSGLLLFMRLFVLNIFNRVLW